MEGIFMRLNIKNFAKIESADILIDGITVIAGENNTGKSTVGKIMFAIFNSLCGVEKKIAEERLKEIESTNDKILRSYITNTTKSIESIFQNYFILESKSKGKDFIISMPNALTQNIEKYLVSHENLNPSDVENIIEDYLLKLRGHEILNKDWDNLIADLVKNIMEICDLSDHVIASEVVSRYFNSVFHNQINTLSDSNKTEAELSLEIKDNMIRLNFENDECTRYDASMNLLHNAIYIDNPFIIDELTEDNQLDPMGEFLKQMLTEKESNGIMDGIIESVRAKEKLAEIYRALQKVVDGQVIKSQDNEFYLKSNNISAPVAVHNLSTGLKSFVILKMLLEKGALKEKDVLILDEPEIHLHPQWQIAYAEMIVLLQKQFDLSIIVTTHSPYFLDAINLFSIKYKIDQKTNFYLSTMDEHGAHMQKVTDHIDVIYKKMASPIQMLDSLRYELNNN